ncbi:MerR family transcriptional regulator [Sporolactobacillus sp. STSJ-5]|uniref:MerR family transcriptional regulator n=1 Tax=Sporolactobacillus sp. STSJ-5 TaxID=2965076 RepID=UPI00210574BC|nr:MerR family transcriptional regulator [Sporolactobacillus sp. STSJ-5]MCQ2011544.1 MerR family transcriptional regulator [Sporolactobacillus sp. STSJ-5]
MVYSIGEFSKLTSLSVDTLRYYEKEKLVHPDRNRSNQRQYTDKDKMWVDFILRLKETAMPIRKIKKYARLREEGDVTLKERMEMLRAHRHSMIKQIEKFEDNLGHLDKKIETYEAMIADHKQ